MLDVNFKSALQKVLQNEGGFTDGKSQIKDMPTNMGIQQKTLDFYNGKYPEKNFPKIVNNLSVNQVIEIYKSEYWDNTKIPKIKNKRIRDAVFDMFVMGGAGKVVQRAVNKFAKATLTVDGVIGDKTICLLNQIDEVDDFMQILKQERLNYLMKTKNWETAKNGWINRLNKY